MARTHNFSAGPSALPLSVLEEVRDELLEYPGLGASIMEVSHRSKQYTAIEASARASLRRLLKLDDAWSILFLSGGASLQFYQVALNFMTPGGPPPGYLVTGHWADLAWREAQRVGEAYCVASSADTQYDRIPKPDAWDLRPGTPWLHYTSNNTIYGTQFAAEPQVDVPLVCDASSDFLSRPIDIRRYGLIYAGAQKNLGPAGTTLVLVHRDFLATRQPNLPVILDYATHAKELYNTPPVFPIYLVDKVLRHLEADGGLEARAIENTEKARRLYAEVDRTGFYRGTTVPEDRSQMNVTFRLPTPELDDRFVREAEEAGLNSLKGYRTVGGIRASIYNAVRLASVDALVAFMRDFEARNG